MQSVRKATETKLSEIFSFVSREREEKKQEIEVHSVVEFFQRSNDEDPRFFLFFCEERRRRSASADKDKRKKKREILSETNERTSKTFDRKRNECSLNRRKTIFCLFCQGENSFVRVSKIFFLFFYFRSKRKKPQRNFVLVRSECRRWANVKSFRRFLAPFMAPSKNSSIWSKTENFLAVYFLERIVKSTPEKLFLISIKIATENYR